MSSVATHARSGEFPEERAVSRGFRDVIATIEQSCTRYHRHARQDGPCSLSRECLSDRFNCVKEDGKRSLGLDQTGIQSEVTLQY